MKNYFILLLSLLMNTNALSLTEGDQLLLESEGIFGKVRLNIDENSNETWTVNSENVDIDGLEFKGAKKSLINWKKVKSSSWLDIKKWIKDRDRRDLDPDWKTKLRLSLNEERFGEVISCIGTCEIFRGKSRVKVNTFSRLFEGDEISTQSNSSAWILLADGNLLRLSAKTSLTLNEINIGNKRVFSSLRLNHGHIKSIARIRGRFVPKNLSETDLGFYPLQISKANREYYSRIEYRKLDEAQRQLYLSKENLGYYSQYKALNTYLDNRDKLYQKKSTLFVYNPVASISVDNGNLDMFYGVNERSFIRVLDGTDGLQKEDSRKTSAQVLLRGYKKILKEDIDLNEWYEVDSKGKTLELSEIAKKFKPLDLLVKRIPTLHLAREILLREKYRFLFQDNFTSKSLALDYGFRLWNIEQKEEISKRINFLFQYTRKVETTNLASISKIFEGNPEAFDNTYYRKSFNDYLFKLKRRYSNKKLIIPELDDSEYYIWMLKYAKK